MALWSSRTDEASRRPAAESWLLLLSFYGVIVSGTLALATAEGTGTYVFAAVAACIAHAFIVGSGRPGLLREPVPSLLAICALGLFYRQATGPELAVGYSAAHFLIILQLVKLFGAHHTRDMRVVQLASLFVILVGTRWATRPAFAPALLSGVLFIMANAVLLAAKVPERRNRPGPAQQRLLKVRELASAMWLPAFILALCVPVAFAAFPRGHRAPQAGMEDAGRTIGFSKSVILGDVGRLRQSREVELRVHFYARQGAIRPLPSAPGIRLRGATLYVYGAKEGKWWDAEMEIRDARSLEQARQDAGEPPVDFMSDETYSLSEARVERLMVDQRVWIGTRPLESGFALYRPVKVYGHPKAIRSITHELRRLSGPRLAAQEGYRVESMIPQFTEDMLREAGTPRRQQGWHFLYHRPQQLDSVLASTIRDVERDYDPRNDYDRVMAAQRYLMDNYGYTLNIPSHGDQDPITAFLTTTRRGSCEHFATALTLLVRHWGMPSRLVLGFKGGEQDRDNPHEFIFRGLHSHAWVEVFFNGLGWVEFDPTPAGVTTGIEVIGQAQERPRGVLAYFVSAWFDAGERMGDLWQAHVVRFSRTRQKWLFVRFKRAARVMALQLKYFVEALAPGLTVRSVYAVVILPFGLIAGSLILSYFARWVARAWRKHRRRSGSDGALFYRDLLAVLKRKGLVRPLQATPREFASAVAGILAKAGESGHRAAAAVAFITDLYCRVRFGGRELTNRQQTQVHDALRCVAAVFPPKRAALGV